MGIYERRVARYSCPSSKKMTNPLLEDGEFDLGKTVEQMHKEWSEKQEAKGKRPSPPKPEPPNPTAAPPTPSNIANPKNYVILPGRNHGSYSYDDLLVSIERLSLKDAEQVLKQLNFYDVLLQRAGKDQHGTQKPLDPNGYLSHINWSESYDILRKLELLMLNLRQGADFLAHVRDGIDGRVKVFDGSETELGRDVLTKIYDDITKVKPPYRAEWYDNKFSQSGRSWNVTYHKIERDGTIREVTEPLQDCLREDKTPGIDLNHWLRNATYQGLPPSDTPQGSLYYWHPRNGSVARFDAYSDGAALLCDRNSQYSNAGLGVRAAKIKR